jgi:hypothetical protein
MRFEPTQLSDAELALQAEVRAFSTRRCHQSSLDDLGSTTS